MVFTRIEKIFRHRIANEKYRQTAKGKISQAKGHKKYHSTEKGKVMLKKTIHKYRHSENGKIVERKYRQSEQGKNIRDKWLKSDNGKVSISKYQQSEKCKIKDRKHRDKRNRKLGWILMFPNPFANDVLVEYHHITDAYVAAIPKDLHRMYLDKNHRENTMEIVKQIYLRGD